jgi:hypothetical protein
MLIILTESLIQLHLRPNSYWDYFNVYKLGLCPGQPHWNGKFEWKEEKHVKNKSRVENMRHRKNDMVKWDAGKWEIQVRHWGWDTEWNDTWTKLTWGCIMMTRKAKWCRHWDWVYCTLKTFRVTELTLWSGRFAIWVKVLPMYITHTSF